MREIDYTSYTDEVVAVEYREKVEVLERIYFGMQDYLDKSFSKNIEIKQEELGRRVGYFFRTSIFSDKLDTKEYKYPSDWKQAFKERFFPQFLLDRFPVQYTIIKYDTTVLYPNIKAPEHEHYIQIRTYEEHL